MFLGKGVLKMGSKFTGEDLCRSVISIKLLGCYPENLMHVFSEHLFLKNTSERLLLILNNLNTLNNLNVAWLLYKSIFICYGDYSCHFSANHV